MRMTTVTDEHGVQKVIPRDHPTINILSKKAGMPDVDQEIVTVHRVSNWTRLNFSDGSYIMLHTSELFQAMGLIFSE